MRYILVLLLAAACGNLQPDPPDSKLNPDAVNTSPGPSNNDTNGQQMITVDPGAFGTSGPATSDGKSAGGNARCTLDDVVTDDLSDVNSAEVPADPWSSSPVADEAARCGDDLETLVWRLHNCERIGAGRQPFACDLRMVWMGREHTLDMIRQDYFRHDNPAGESPFDRMDRHGIGWAAGAENIATGSSVLELHYRWMDSAGHRGNILGNYSHAGLGIEPNRDGLLATGVFLNPR